MSNALPWFRIEVLQVANDLSDVKSLEGEGAYFRVLRHLWLNGPQPIEQLQRKCRHTFDELEHLFINCSTTDEQLFSVEWIEAQRAKADNWRANKSLAGKKSAELRASKSKKKNRRSTAVEQPTSTSTSILTQKGKDSATESDTVADDFNALWITFERYGSKGKALAYYRKLSQDDRDAVHAKAGEYVASTPGCEYRKQLEGWINPANRLWERPIPKKTLQINGQQTDEERRAERNRIIAERYAGQ